MADLVDELVLFYPILGPLSIEFELFTLLLGSGDWDEIARQAAGCYDFVGDAFFIEVEVAGRLLVRRVQDRVFDHHLCHGRPLASERDKNA